MQNVFSCVSSPDFGRNANNWEEMAIEVEVPEEAFDSHAIDGEGHLGDGKVNEAANHITFLERLLSCTHLLWLASYMGAEFKSVTSLYMFNYFKNNKI